MNQSMVSRLLPRGEGEAGPALSGEGLARVITNGKPMGLRDARTEGGFPLTAPHRTQV